MVFFFFRSIGTTLTFGTRSQQHLVPLSSQRHMRSLENHQSRIKPLRLWVRVLTDIIGIQVFAEVRKAGPSQNEKVDLCNKVTLLRSPVESVPDDGPDSPAQGCLLHWGFPIARGRGRNRRFRRRNDGEWIIGAFHNENLSSKAQIYDQSKTDASNIAPGLPPGSTQRQKEAGI